MLTLPELIQLTLPDDACPEGAIVLVKIREPRLENGQSKEVDFGAIGTELVLEYMEPEPEATPLLAPAKGPPS